MNLRTKSFGFEDLSNTKFSNNRNAGISTSVGLSEVKEGKSTEDSKSTTSSVDKTKGSKTETKLNTSSVQYSNSTGYEKTKTLATLGNGNIVIANSDDSTLEGLNRDTTQTNKDIYKVDRQQGNIDLTIDHRLFSSEGRKAIKEDYKRTAILGEAIVDLGDDSVSLLGGREKGESSFRENLMKKQDFFTAVKNFSSNKENEKYIEVLTNGKASAEDKQLAYTMLANSVAKQLDIPITQAKLLIQENSNDKGYYSKENKTIYVVDNNTSTTGDAVNTVGHEVSHYIDDSRDSDAAYTQTKIYKDNREGYAHIMGEALEDYTGFAFAMNGYNSLDAINQKTGSRDVFGRPIATIQENNEVFSRLNPNEIEHRQFNKNEAGVIDRIRLEINNDSALTTEQKEIKTQQAIAIACADVNCAKGVPEDDVKYKEIKAIQDLGEQLKKDGLKLASLTTKEINADLFNYNWSDGVNDFLSQHDEARVRTGGVIRTGAGGAGMFGGAALTVGGVATCGVTLGAGCAAATVGGVPLTYLSYTEARDGINQTFDVYNSPVGEQVYDSFSLQTHQDNLSPLQNMGLTSIIATGEMVSAKFGGKYAEKGIEKWNSRKGAGSIVSGDVVPDSLSASQLATRERILANIAESKAAREASRFDIQKGFEIALFGDVSTAKNGAVFYSGRTPGSFANADLAESFANQTGKDILNFTPAGKQLDALNLYPRLVLGENGKVVPSYATETSRVWEITSRRFSEGASGRVNTFVNGAHPNSIFNRIELPALQNNPNVIDIRILNGQ